ncbi:rho-related GTP-binding protein RhoN-like [Morone saxatilis]|uniref:rho-related GTP-binding protein RhoN-like n=1 Tax=Morone saxatilis TaxID=34816 RepID=UPI0015E22D52|nr:rho-related GTP-binding protein RhoN-like [Morone saxatilis]
METQEGSRQSWLLGWMSWSLSRGACTCDHGYSYELRATTHSFTTSQPPCTVSLMLSTSATEPDAAPALINPLQTATLTGSAAPKAKTQSLWPYISTGAKPSQHPSATHPSPYAICYCVSTGSSYYDNVRPLAYPDSDAVLICFDISRPETLDSVIKKWQGETQEFCPNAKVVLVGCKLDMRTDVNTLRELSKQRLIPVTHEQGSTIARQIGAVAYVECTSKVSENSVRDVFHVTTLASVRRPHKPQLKRSSSRRGLKRVSQLPLPPLPGRTEQMDQAPAMRKDRAKSCVLM